MITRKICPVCTSSPVAINYIRKGKTYYRKLCAICIRKNKKLKPVPPGWYRTGYRKKSQCERCSFKAKHPNEQLRVYYLDGDLRNNDWSNLKTICLLCQVEVQKSNLPWKPGEIVPDF